ncbi:MAG TPA: hypothetical protein VG147_04995 [Solirubrobacteraceae bacterium]|jgi:hypothetical protein|nr:hypothetical protein [Solirubrobacteraceae bacterium]
MGTALAASVTVLAMVPSASAHHPTGVFAKFAQCPFENPTVALCTYSESTSGVLQIGKVIVPLVKPQILQGGDSQNPETGQLTSVDAVNGETLVKVAQLVPEGLLGNSEEGQPPLRNLCKDFHSNSGCSLTSTEELVGETHLSLTNLLFEEGTALEVPLVLHMKNSLLGSECFIGTPSEPIVVKFTTGSTSPPPPNGPVHGSSGSLQILAEGSYISSTGSVLVDNAFALPVAHGCGRFDWVVDRRFGLPSAAGQNTMILSGELALAAARAVEISEGA